MTDVPGDWPKDRIQEAIYDTGISVTALAEREGVEGSTLRSALIRRSPAGQLIIANHLGVRPQEIWPSRYPNDGKRMRRPQRPSHNLHTAGSSGQRQNDGAS